MRHSFVVNAEHNTGTEERRVFIGETGVVIVHFVPEALGSETDTLSINLSDNTLNDNFVARYVESFNGGSNLVDNVFSLFLGIDGVIVLSLKVELNHILDDLLDSRGVESKNKNTELE